MDTFNTLPPEILLHIISNIHDFQTLSSILQTSTAINNVFHSHASHITECILASCRTTSYETHKVFRALAVIKSPGYQCTFRRDFDKFMATLPAIGHLMSGYGLSSRALCGLMDDAAAIGQMADTCLNELLNRINSLEITTIDRGLRFRRSRPRPLIGKPVKTLNAGPPSWLELFRVHRAVWFLFLREELLHVARGSWGWGKNDIRAVERNFSTIWDILVFEGEMGCVEDVLCDLLRVSSLDGIHIPRMKRLLPQKVVFGVPPVPEEFDVLDDWEGNRTTGFSRLYHFYEGVIVEGHAPPGVVCGWKPWEKWGFPIWSSWRAYCLRLVPLSEKRLAPDGVTVVGGTSEDQPTLDENWFRWMSVLNGDIQTMRQDEE